MKKFMRASFFTLAIVVLSACHSGAEHATADKKTVTSSLSDNPDYQKGLGLIGQNDCLTCHTVNDDAAGPAFVKIAARYPHAADSTILRLAKKVVTGGSGDFGQVPMSAHPTLPEAQAVQMVKYILLLQKENE